MDDSLERQNPVKGVILEEGGLGEGFFTEITVFSKSMG